MPGSSGSFRARLLGVKSGARGGGRAGGAFSTSNMRKTSRACSSSLRRRAAKSRRGFHVHCTSSNSITSLRNVCRIALAVGASDDTDATFSTLQKASFGG